MGERKGREVSPIVLAAARRDRENYRIAKLIDERTKLSRRLHEIEEELAMLRVRLTDGSYGTTWERLPG